MPTQVSIVSSYRSFLLLLYPITFLHHRGTKQSWVPLDKLLIRERKTRSIYFCDHLSFDLVLRQENKNKSNECPEMILMTNRSTGGGLYARAGLGNGRHEAAAGLGGLLDGSGRSGAGARGGLFAGATTGSRGVGVSTGGSTGGSTSTSAPSNGQNGPSGASPGEDAAKPSKGRSNIQIIRKKDKGKQVRETLLDREMNLKDVPLTR